MARLGATVVLNDIRIETAVTSQIERTDAVIVGAGFAGLYMLHKCREIGISAQLFEAGGGVGGTWYWNRYPGARCDTESIMYSYSFDDDLQREWSWSERYATSGEIRSYLDHVADRFDLRRDISLETRVLAAEYDEAARRWLVTTDTGRSVECTYFITAVGCLSIAQVPAWQGQDRFRGSVFHTAQWPEVEPDLAGKRVGVIGTGSSAIQAIPILAERAQELFVFQRTASFSLPARNEPMNPQDEQRVKATYGELRHKARHSPYGNFWDLPEQSALDVAAEEREQTFERFWEAGSSQLVASFNDLGRNPDANELAAEFVRGKIADLVDDPEVARLLTPRGYPIATKRLCLDTDYYVTYNRPDVQLVDVSEDPIVELTETGLRTTTSEFELDVIVFATGFDAVTGGFLAIDIRGRDGLPLSDHWADGPHAYLGIATAGFPNMFMVTGPLSPSALSIVTVSIEQHVQWIGDALTHLRDSGMTTMETSEEFENEWDDQVQAAVDRTLHSRATFTYYWGGNIPGKPKKFLQYPGGVGPYRAICDTVVADGYRGFVLS